MTGQYYNCLSCNATNHRSTLTPTPPYNNTCPCDSGYEDVGVAMCGDICGDGQALSSACDDGNTVSGDGCSSTCTIEDYFSCVKDVSLFSTCYFVANLTM
jgi:cysteine-rich repeat protein